MRYIALQILLICSFFNSASADSAFINMKKVTQTPYSCSNGGQIRFSPTRYGNVWKLIFSKPGAVSQFAFVNFYIQTDYFSGDVTTWMSFPENRDELPFRGPVVFSMTVTVGPQGLEMKMESIRNSSLNFVCHNF